MNSIGTTLVRDLKTHPLTLALVIVNLLFLTYMVREISASSLRKDTLISTLMRDCAMPPTQKGDRQ
jgi:hypothetical protein